MPVILVVLCVDVAACSPYSGCCCTATTRLGRARNNINTKHNKYNRHATTNQIILSLVTEVKEKYISLRMVKN